MKIDEANIKKKHGGVKSVVLHIRITPHLSKWLREKDYSPTGIFNEAIKSIGYKE